MKIVGVSAAAALLGCGMLLLAPGPGSAMALPSFAVAAPGETKLVEKVDNHRRSHRERRHSRRYDRHRHGPRYSHRRPGFHFQYGGYYYANPWWIGPGIGFGVTVPVVPHRSAHIDWCINNFRSYDVSSDTFLGHDGYRHRCNSPFRY